MCADAQVYLLLLSLLPPEQDGDVNCAEALVAAGLAEVMRHGTSDDRSSHYDALLAAEVSAKAANKGVHSPKDPPARRVADLSTDSTRAKACLSALQVLMPSRKHRNARHLACLSLITALSAVAFRALRDTVPFATPGQHVRVTAVFVDTHCPSLPRTLSPSVSVNLLRKVTLFAAV